jgi:hypothetical protein
MTDAERYWLIHLTRTADTTGWLTGDVSTPQPTPSTLAAGLDEALRFDDPDDAERHAHLLRDQGAADHVDVFEFLNGDDDSHAAGE